MGLSDTAKPPVVCVHGAFCGGWAFDAFRALFEAAGYRTYAPDLPCHEAGADPAALARLGVRRCAEAVAHFVHTLPAPPVLIGHSLGGLVAQLVAARTETAGLVLLAPSAPWGVLPTTVEEHGSGLSLALLGDYWRRPVQADYGVARQVSLDRLEEAAARRIFAQFVPESGRVVMETLQWWLDPTAASAAPAYRIGAPVLAIAGERDRVNPASTVRRIAGRFPGGQAAFHSFPEMSHWLIEEPGWEDVARLALAWMATRDLTSRPAGRATAD